MNNKKYNNFKIFAIQPLKDCGVRILKVLKEEEIYYLFNDYQIDAEGKLSYSKSYPQKLYHALKIRLDICAIAGKNGTGKSTLIELLLVVILNV